MIITLPRELAIEIRSAAEFLQITPESLVETFVKDGLLLYNDGPDEYRDTIEVEPKP
jgi:hypothetical protein